MVALIITHTVFYRPFGTRILILLTISCSDCMLTEFDKIYSVHYTMCRKPWQCMAIGTATGQVQHANGQKSLGKAIATDIVNIEHCYELNRHWHELRADFEKKLLSLTQDKTILKGTTHGYKQDIFLGHCSMDGNDGYQVISAQDETFKRVAELYN